MLTLTATSRLRALSAALLPILACGVQLLGWPIIRPYIWFLFYPTVFLSSWIGGFGAGLAATVLSAALAWWFFMEPVHVLVRPNPSSYLNAAMFLAMGWLFSAFHRRLRSADRRAEAAEESVARERAEAKLAAQDALLDRTSRLAKVGGWEFDPATLKGAWTAEVARIHDLDPGTLPDVTSGLGFYLEEDRPIIAEAVRAAMEEGRPYDLELQLVTALGTRKWVRTTGQPDLDHGRVVRVSGVLQDITDRKLAELALRDSEARLRSLFEQAGVGVVEVDVVSGRFLQVNPAFCAFLGYAPEELLAMTFADLTHPADQNLSLSGAVGIRSGELPAFVTEKRYVRKDGASVWAQLTATPLRVDGAPTGHVVSIVADISARKRAEADLRASEERFATVFQASPMGIVLAGLEDQRILGANPAFLALLGWDEAELQERKALDLAFWNNPDERLRAWEVLLETGRLRNFEMLFRSSAGAPGRASVSAEVVTIGGERVVLAFIEDITEVRTAQDKERQLERELNHLQRLESVGRLAGGVSHDMNNVLAAVMAMSSLLQSKFAHLPEVARSAVTILDAASRGRDLVKGLTDFSRKEVRDASPLDLNALVRKEAELLERTTFKKVTIVVDLEEPLAAIHGEASALANSLMNLCVNACDAMPDGGELRLQTRMAADGRVELAVQDTGEGMTAEVAARAMEPFFTTKAPGKGTGMGLASVYGTVKAHGGTVELRSQPGEGTRVALLFPPLTAPAGAAPPAAGLPEPGSRPLRILLVDDEDLIRQTVPRLLAVLGHQVEVAPGGMEGLAMLEAGLTVDWVILDLNMPDMTGLETLTRLRALRPDLPVLVSTGYRDPATQTALRGFSRVGILDKPYLLDDLKRALI